MGGNTGHRDTGGRVSVEGRQMTTLCGVLGMVEAALGSSIPSLAVSGPHSATENDGHDDSFQQTRELFADWQPGVAEHPVQDSDAPHILHSSKAVAVEPDLKMKKGWRDGYLRFPPDLVRS